MTQQEQAQYLSQVRQMAVKDADLDIGGNTGFDDDRGWDRVLEAWTSNFPESESWLDVSLDLDAQDVYRRYYCDTWDLHRDRVAAYHDKFWAYVMNRTPLSLQCMAYCGEMVVS